MCHEFNILGLPWWLSSKESACQCRRHGFDPRSRKIPGAVEQLGVCSTATQHTCLNRRACAPHRGEKLVHRDCRQAGAATKIRRAEKNLIFLQECGGLAG